MRNRLLAAAALAAAMCLGAGIGWLVWGNDSEHRPDTQVVASSTLVPVATEPTPLISLSFGPTQIWRIDQNPEAITAIHECAAADLDWNDCIWQAMQQHSGSRDAFDFFELTDGFLQDLQGDGVVKLGIIAYPWRANEIVQPILLGGYPPVIEIENPALRGAVEHDPGFTILQSRHPNIMFWGASPTLESSSIMPNGSQVFIFRYRLLDGCHACEVLGYARVEYDFFPSGRLLGSTPKLLGVIEAEN